MRCLLCLALFIGWVAVPMVTRSAMLPHGATSQEAPQPAARFSEELIASAVDRDNAENLQIVRGPERNHLLWKQKRAGRGLRSWTAKPAGPMTMSPK